jgi:hypothetical protein
LSLQLRIFVEQEAGEIDQLIAHALHGSKQLIEVGSGIVGSDTFDISQNRFEPCDRGDEPVPAIGLRKRDDLCSHARSPASGRSREAILAHRQDGSMQPGLDGADRHTEAS